MQLLLQESGGLRRTAPVQSPVPIRPRLTGVQRLMVLGFVVMLVFACVLGALLPSLSVRDEGRITATSTAR